MAKLFAGPYVGEFGWLLFGWQGFLRSMSKDYDHVAIAGREDHRIFYEDFVDEYIPYEPMGIHTRYTKCKDEHVPAEFYDPFQGYDKIIPAQTQLVSWSQSRGFFHYNQQYVGDHKQEFRRFGNSKDNLFDIIFHARDTEKCGSKGRNWGQRRWDRLYEKFKGEKVVFIGSKEEAYCPIGAPDLRGMRLRYVIDIIAGAKVVVGGSSGPIHLASLCGTPHVVWGHPLNKRRYEQDWNPLKTPVRFHGADYWRPSVDTVEGLVVDVLT